MHSAAVDVRAAPLAQATPAAVARGPQQVVRLRTQDLQRLDADSVRARNALYRSAPWRDADAVWRWTGGPPARRAYRVMLQCRGERLCLDLADDIVGLEEGVDDWAAFEPATRLLMWTLAHERFIDLLQRVFGRDWMPLAIDLDPAAADWPAAMRIDAGFVVQVGDGPRALIRGRAVFPRAWCDDLAERAACGSAPTTASSPWAAGRVRLRCVIDSVTASACDMALLQPRAVVLLDNASLAGPRAKVRLAVGTHTFGCELSGSRLLVALWPGEPMMSNPLSAAALDGSAIAADDAADHAGDDASGAGDAGDTTAPMLSARALPVVLSFEAGSVSIPFSQLEHVRPGFVFELAQSLADSVIRVHANGVEVAAGELVCIGDQLGVRLTRVG